MAMAESGKEKDALSGVETTGHEWDGIKELNNPAPRWWLWVFLLCIVWAVWYWVMYPAWPVPGGNTQGIYGWTQHAELKEQQAVIDEQQLKYLLRFHKATLQEIAKDPELYEFARAGGAIAFKNNCAQCHGGGAEGGKGYPNLNDDDWLWGGKLEDIYKTIHVGIRSTHPETRMMLMPAFGQGILKPDQIGDVAEYVIKLHEADKAEKTPGYTMGKDIFAQNCAMCHGAGGEGDRSKGAPRLSDNIWLYGGTKADVIRQVTDPRHGVMPTWEDRLNEDTIKELTIYVHTLGGGE
jgi:cytochrome c oxidase cbb3-type subunit 3